MSCVPHADGWALVAATAVFLLLFFIRSSASTAVALGLPLSPSCLSFTSHLSCPLASFFFFFFFFVVDQVNATAADAAAAAAAAATPGSPAAMSPTTSAPAPVISSVGTPIC